ncbi:hypothetical protein SK128_009950, partial [Halocaridina rubra]
GGGLTTDGVSECYSGLQVRCPGHERCVSPYWICDGAPDCPNGLDEIGCDKSPCEGYRCWDNICIPGAWRCDGHRDCKDGDDEFACAGCGDGELACSTAGFCYSPNVTCNGIPDCPDGWDESLAVCGGKECSPGELPCWDNDHCVQHNRLCDGKPDCPAAEDEDRSFCIAFRSMRETTTIAVDLQASLCHNKPPIIKDTSNCSQDQFKCKGGECIPKYYLCNGHFDCESEEDEDVFHCTIDKNDDKQHIPEELDSDEESNDVFCDKNMLKCPDGRCVSKTEECLNTVCLDNEGNNSCNTSKNMFEHTESSTLESKDNDVMFDSLPDLFSADNNEPEPNTHNDSLLTPDILENDMISGEIINEVPSIDSSEENTHDTAVLDDIVEDMETSAETDYDSVETKVFHNEKNTIGVALDMEDSNRFLEVEDSDRLLMSLLNSSSSYNASLSSVHNISDTENEIEEAENDSTQLVDLDSEELNNDIHMNMSSRATTDDTGIVMRGTSGELNLNEKGHSSIYTTVKSFMTDSEEITNDSRTTVNSFTSGGSPTYFTNFTVLPTSDKNDSDGAFDGTVSVDGAIGSTGTPEITSSMFAISSVEGDTVIHTTTSEPTLENMSSSDASKYELLDVTDPTIVSYIYEESVSTEDLSNTLDVTTEDSDVTFSESTPVELVEDMEGRQTSTEMIESEDTEFYTESTDQILSTHDVITNHSVAYTTESNNWKALPMGEKNVTVFIAIHSSGNESKIPQYIIQGMDGSTYQYEVVSVVNEEESINKSNSLLEEKKQGVHGKIHELSYFQRIASSGLRPSLCLMMILPVIANIFFLF